MFSDWSLLIDIKLIDFHVFVQCSLAKLSRSCSFCCDFYLFFKMYLSMAVLGLHWCTPALSSCSEQGCSLRCTGVSLWWFLLSWSAGPRLTGFSCSVACEIFRERDPLHRQAASYPLSTRQVLVCLFLDSLGFSAYIIMLSVTRDCLISSFLMCLALHILLQWLDLH